MKQSILSVLIIAAMLVPAVLVAQHPIQVVSPVQFSRLIDSLDSFQLLDVRTRVEFRTGHIDHARLQDINQRNFARQVDKLDRNQPVLVYCRSGKRSHEAAVLLQQMGFREIIDLDGGIMAWEAANNDIQERQ